MKSTALSLLTLYLMVGFVPAQDTFSPDDLAEALELHRNSVVLDTHSDVTMRLTKEGWNFAERHDDGHMDIPRMRDSHMDAEFFSIYMGRTPGEGRAIRRAIRLIDTVIETVRKHPEDLEQAFTAEDVRRIRKAGRIACLMGIEGGHIIEESLHALRMFHRLGCRYMTLTHSFNVPWADSSGTNSDPKAESGGLTDLGREIVTEMNRLGMMVDISHVADTTFWDAIKTSRAPVIASHSSVDGVFNHRRNMSDKMLKAVTKNGGVVMINFYNGYIDPEWDGVQKRWEEKHRNELKKIEKEFGANLRERRRARSAFRETHPIPRTSLTVLAKHVEHAADVMGWDHVGIGADWDGVSGLPEGMEHCGRLTNLTALLLARGATPDQLRGFLGANLLRVMEGCEKTSREMASEAKR